jgi:hypothetical protein
LKSRSAARPQICARVDYIAGLQEQIPEQQPGEAIREEFKVLVKQCRTELRDRAEETSSPSCTTVC